MNTPRQRTHLQEMTRRVGLRPTIQLAGESTAFDVHRMRGVESLSRPFEFEIEIIPQDMIGFAPGDIVAEEMLGRAVTVQIGPPGADSRAIHGLIGEWSTIPVEQSQIPNHYRLKLVPFLAFWDLNVGYAMYEDVMVADVLSDLADRWQVSFLYQLFGTSSTREYCCQFEETDLHFFSRLIAEEGIFYFFRHTAADHQLVLADGFQGTDSLNGSIQYDPEIGDWSAAHRVRAGRYTACGFDADRGELIASNETTLLSVANNERFEKTRYFAALRDTDAARRRSRLGIQPEELGQEVHRASSIRPELSAGMRFNLTGHIDSRFDGEYLLTSVTHSFNNEEGYSNSFTCVPNRDGVSFTPDPVEEKPVARGPHTALVVEDASSAPAGGKVRVRFPWNVEEDKCCCWIRVAEMIAGSERGTWFPPHVGEEVMVEFLNGDPDRPIVTGRLYNGANTPSETTPDVMLIETRAGHSLRLDDQQGQEHILLHSANDLKLYAERGEVVIENATGSKITLSPSGMVTVTTPGTMEINASQVTAACGMLQVDAGISKFSGVVQCATLITNSVVSSSYTPGAGNIW